MKTSVVVDNGLCDQTLLDDFSEKGVNGAYTLRRFSAESTDQSTDQDGRV